MKWDQDNRSLVSVGDITFNSFDKYKLERAIKAKMEITKRRSGDEFQLYFESPQGGWYYFKYAKGVMYTVSSDKNYNTLINNDYKKVNTPEFKLRPINASQKNNFVKPKRK